jgi:hypothetical protein
VTAARSSAFGTRATRLAAVATELPPLRRRPGRPVVGSIDRFLRHELTGAAVADNLRRVADAQYRSALAAHATRPSCTAGPAFGSPIGQDRKA